MEKNDVLQLDPSQLEAIDKLYNFIVTAGTENIATLSGSAGTGKTTIIKKLIQRIKNDEETIGKISMTVSAPTHKARKVIQSVTELQARTIQSLCGLRPDLSVEMFDYNNPIFGEFAEPAINDYKVVIIDECSMINRQLYDFILKLISKPSSKTKVIYIGDSLQLPPIKEKLSVTFVRTHLKVNLTKIFRQEDEHPITEVLIKIREDIANSGTTNSGLNLLLSTPYNVVNDVGFQILDNNQFNEKIELFYQMAYNTQDKDFVKTLAYTNIAVGQYNDFIRLHLPHIDHTQPLCEGDLITGRKTLAIKQGDEQIIKIINSEDYFINSIEPRVNYYGLNVLHTKYVSAEGAFENEIDIVNPNDIVGFRKLFNEKLKAGLEENRWRDYYAFKENLAILKPITNTKTDSYYKKPDYISADIDYGYALTIHKSQGSTYSNIFVDLNNILINYDKIERLKLMYVALSRATNLIFIKY